MVELDERPPAATVPVAAAATPGGRLVANALYRTVSDIASKLALAVLYLVMARQLGTSGFGLFSFAFPLAVIVPQRLGVAVAGTFALYRGVHVVGIAAIYLAGSLLALPLAISLLRDEVARPPLRVSVRRWPRLLVASLPIGVATAFATILFR